MSQFTLFISSGADNGNISTAAQEPTDQQVIVKSLMHHVWTNTYDTVKQKDKVSLLYKNSRNIVPPTLLVDSTLESHHIIYTPVYSCFSHLLHPSICSVETCMVLKDLQPQDTGNKWFEIVFVVAIC